MTAKYMPRRQKTSPIEGLMNAMSRMPWWACLVAGAVAYVLLAARGVAGVLQYVLPILCCAAAFMSFLVRRKRRERCCMPPKVGPPPLPSTS